MLSHENRPASSSQRPILSLTIDTSGDGIGQGTGKGKAGGNTNLDSPPRTPTAQTYHHSRAHATAAAAATKAPVPRTNPRGTFLEDITPVNTLKQVADVDEEKEYRDSHDLSISPRQITRDSLVDNMLLSLDQMTSQPDTIEFSSPSLTAEDARLFSSFADDNPSSPYRNYGPRNGRAPGLGYSHSSEHDNADSLSRYSDHSGRGRRSNSTSNFQTGSLVDGRGGNKGQQNPPRGYHVRGKGTKAGSANSFDIDHDPQMRGSSRWGQSLAGRASSFDHGMDRQAMAQANPVDQLANSNNTTYTLYDYDAAPTPTVPGGPRRFQSNPPIFPPPEAVHPVEPTKLDRKKSTKSSKSSNRTKQRKSALSSTRSHYGLYDQSPELPPLPAFSNESTPSASEVHGKDEVLPCPNQAQPARDRHGFFRRVFGSSKNHVSATQDPPRSHGSTTSNDTAERSNSQPQQVVTPLKSSPMPQYQDPPFAPVPKEHVPMLSKKPSSFFRRRKKSISEPGTPPPHIFVPVPKPAPLVPTKPLPDRLKYEQKPEESPVSSLRQVMNPYLRSPVKNRLDFEPFQQDLDGMSDQEIQDLRGFLPDYEPDTVATVRAVKPSSRSAHEPPLNAPPPPPKHVDVDYRTYTFVEGSQSKAKQVVAVPLEKATFGISTSTATLDCANSTDDATTHQSTTSRNAYPSAIQDIATIDGYERTHSKGYPMVAEKGQKASLEDPAQVISARSNQTRAANNLKDEDWVMITPDKSPRNTDERKHMRLEPSLSEEDFRGAIPYNWSLPLESSSIKEKTAKPKDTVHLSTSNLPTVQVERSEDDRTPSSPVDIAVETIQALNDQQPQIVTTPAIDDIYERAKSIFEHSNQKITRDTAAAWLGEAETVHAKTLQAYMELHDFTNLNILAALRSMCNRLTLKAESQQVDRILTSFAQRWCQTNPNHGFKAIDVVHTICYSLLLLNTDLHLADIEQKMTRSQFVKNTMPTIRKSVIDAAPDAFEGNRPSILPSKSRIFETESSTVTDTISPEVVVLSKPSMDAERPSWRASIRAPARQETDINGTTPTPLNYDTGHDACGPLVRTPFVGTLRTWGVQVEIILKDFYTSIKNERLPLSSSAVGKSTSQTPSSSSLQVFTNGMLRRSPSVLSKAPSETQASTRGRTAETMRAGNSKWGNKNRSRSRLYPGSAMGSSRTSLDDQSSMWSPSVSSSTWSKYSLGKTQTSMSMDSLRSNLPSADYQQAIGFANALSQAIIREENPGSVLNDANAYEELRAVNLLEDNSLGLAGAPWAKEGIVKHKHHLESLNKKAKDRNWNDTFAVIEKGYMSLFSFSSKSMRKSKGKTAGGVVGGGNWQENAENLGSFLLRQTIASALPPPGYSKVRPHVWALSLPTGAVHLFQVGTPDIVKEFVSTANYWSARLSNHPLVGGISNVEYGWSDAVVNNSLVTAIDEATISRPSTPGTRPSLQSSIRSSLDHGRNTGIRARLAGDRIHISDWTPPTQSMRASNLLERDQLKTLQVYVSSIEGELQKHNQLRSPMLLAFSPRHSNAHKAMTNWEKKSSYLLREIVKFRTYIDSLLGADATKQRIYAERASVNMDDKQGDEDDNDDTLRP